MGLIYNILKDTKTKQLATPMVKINSELIISTSDKNHQRTIMAMEQKRKSGKELTNKDQRAFRSAVSALERRGSVTIVTEIEVPKR